MTVSVHVAVGGDAIVNDKADSLAHGHNRTIAVNATHLHVLLWCADARVKTDSASTRARARA